jgi:hypothetical protein
MPDPGGPEFPVFPDYITATAILVILSERHANFPAFFAGVVVASWGEGPLVYNMIGSRYLYYKLNGFLL